MNVEFKASFVKDLKKVKEQSPKDRVRRIIALVEQADSYQDITGFKKLRGSNRYYRIRVGEYRIGLLVEGNTVTFVRFLHRKDIYRYFP